MVMKKKRKPAFNVSNLGFRKQVKARWRKPRGSHNKKRMKFQWTGAMPNIGYKNSADVRGLHPSGNKEVLISTPSELVGLKDVVLRIAGSVGAKKRAVIVEKAKALKLRVVNAGYDSAQKPVAIQKVKEAPNPKEVKSKP